MQVWSQTRHELDPQCAPAYAPAHPGGHWGTWPCLAALSASYHEHPPGPAEGGFR